MLYRLNSYLNANNILFEHQYGFQKKKSTVLAVLDLINKITDAFDNSSYSAVVFLDFAKAFDTVNFNILLDKLSHYGITGTPLNWFKSYLTSRRQVVALNGTLSDELTVTCGVPQGSVLGPILFLLYINDLPNSSKILDFFLFADDTSLLYSSKSLNELEYTINCELVNIQQWLLSNKLSLNVSKSNFILFHSPYMEINHSVILKIGDEIVKEKDSTKYLGIIIDKHLSWKEHISSIVIKLSKSIGILRKISYNSSLQVLKQIYFSFFYPYLTYAVLLWGSASATSLNPIKILQKKAVRVLLNKSWNAHTRPLFYQLQLLTLEDIYNLYISLFMYDIYHQNINTTFINMFSPISNIHHYNTRASKSQFFYLKFARTKYKQNFITTKGIKIWEKIPNDFKSERRSLFKHKMIHFFLNNYKV